MDNRSSIRTVGYVAAIAVLLIVLFLVAGISTGFLPWRDSYAENPWPTKNPETVVTNPTATPDGTGTVEPTPTVTPTPTPTVTPTPTPEPTPENTLDEELPTYNITVTFSRGGTAIPYGMNAVVQNGSMIVMAVPDEGYVVDEMYIDGVRYTGIDSYTFENVNEDHTVYISFSRSLFAPTPTPTPVVEEIPEITPTPIPTPVPEDVSTPVDTPEEPME